MPIIGLGADKLERPSGIGQRCFHWRFDALFHRLLNEPILDRGDRDACIQDGLQVPGQAAQSIAGHPAAAVDKQQQRGRLLGGGSSGLPKMEFLFGVRSIGDVLERWPRSELFPVGSPEGIFSRAVEVFVDQVWLHALPPGVVGGGQSLDDIPMVCGNVGLFTGVGLDVIEFPGIRLVAGIDQAPAALPQTAVVIGMGSRLTAVPTAPMGDQRPVRPGGVFVEQQRHQAAALDLFLHPVR